MPRKWHVRFLGGCGPATGRAYPTCDVKSLK